jgi:hypothetical protein
MLQEGDEVLEGIAAVELGGVDPKWDGPDKLTSE